MKRLNLPSIKCPECGWELYDFGQYVPPIGIDPDLKLYQHGPDILTCKQEEYTFHPHGRDLKQVPAALFKARDEGYTL